MRLVSEWFDTFINFAVNPKQKLSYVLIVFIVLLLGAGSLYLLLNTPA